MFEACALLPARETAEWEFPKIRGTFFRGPNNKAYNRCGSILKSPIYGNYQIDFVMGLKKPYRDHLSHAEPLCQGPLDLVLVSRHSYYHDYPSYTGSTTWEHQ